MNQLYVQANKAYNHGFVLTESELRRFIELIREQVRKINPNPDIQYRYKLKYQNGVVADTDELDSVLSQENEGSKRIISIHINGKDQLKNIIAIELHNTDSDNSISEHSIKYTIKSKDRDWVFVTSSLIEERVTKIKRFNLIPGNRSTSRLFSLFIPLILTLGMLISLTTSITKRDDYLTGIKEEYYKGKIKETSELLIKIEEARQKQTEKLDMLQILYFPGILTGGLILLGIIIYIYLWKLYPLYNFCWGDYLEVFRKRETARKTFNTVVILGLIVSIIGGVITNYLTLK